MKLLYYLFCILLFSGVLVWAVNLFLAMRDIDTRYYDDWKCFRLDEDKER